MGRSASSSSSDLTSAAPRVTEGEVALRYDVQESIGHGAYGEALLALRREEGGVVVIKRVRISDLSEKEREGAINEVKLLAQFHHSNIIRYYECIVEGGNLNIVMEYADEGELSTVLQSRAEKKKPYKEDQIMFMFVQLALALFHVHGKNVLHRDLKSANVFLSKGGVLKLGDFGISRVLNSSASMAKTAIGTPYYLSPEILEDQPYNAKSDVWALGCILYELTTLKRAFDGAHLPGLIAKILRGVIPPIPTKYSSSLRNLVTSMLQQRPQDRPSVQQILRQDYVRQYVTRYARHMMDLSEGAEEEPVLGIPEANRPPPSASGAPNPPRRRASGVTTAAAAAAAAPASAASAAQTTTPRTAAAAAAAAGRGPSRHPSGAVSAASAGVEPSISGQGPAGATVAGGAGPPRQAAPVNRRRWSASKREQSAQEKREVANLPDDPRKTGGAPPSSSSDHQGLQVQGLGAARIPHSALPPPSRAGASADESFSQAAVSISAQGYNPQPTGMVGAGTRVRPRGPGFGGTKSQGAASSVWMQGQTTPTSEQHVKMDVRKTKYEMENQQKVKAAREHKAQMKVEKDRREREEAAKLREEKRAAKLLKEQEDAKKAKEKEEHRARQGELEAQLREKASLRAKEKQESKRRLQEHKESLKAVRPTLDRASLRRDFAARQQAQAEGESVFVRATASAEEPQQQQHEVKPPSPVPSRLHYHSPGAKSPPTGSPSGSPQKKTISSKLAGLTTRRSQGSRSNASPAATPPTEAPAAAGRRQRRLWSKTSAQGPQIPAVEIYVPSLKVWEDEEEEEEEEDSPAQQGQEQQQTKQAEARAEVTDGLRELRDFMSFNKQQRQDPVKQIWDTRKDRDLLQVLEEMEDVLDWEVEEDGRAGPDSASGSPPPQQQRLPQVAAAAGGGGSDSSPPIAEATAARIERLRDNLERQLGFERFLSVYKHLRSAQDDEGGAQGSLEGIIGPEEMHLVRDVNKLMIMEDKVFA